MDQAKRKLLHIFDEHVFGSMQVELELAIRAGAVNLAAVGLVTYTEFLGGLITGNLGKRDFSKRNFVAFLPFLGPEYESLNKQGVDIYDRVRCGLVHQYWIKGESTIWGTASSPCGIVGSKEGPVYFIVPQYRDDLLGGARRLRDKILEDTTGQVVELAERALSNIEK